MTDSDLSPTTQQKALCNGWAIWFLPLTTSVLLYASYFPLAIGWFAWFALIPWLVLVKLRGGWRLYCSAYLSGLAFYLPVLQWARVADPRMYVTWIILAFYCSLYFPLVLALTRRINRTSGLPLIITFPVVWVTGEYLRWGMAGSFISLITNSHQHDVPGGFSWYMLGYSQQDWLPIIQIADLGGVYAVSFLVAMINALLFELIYSTFAGNSDSNASVNCATSGSYHLIGKVIFVILIATTSLLYGFFRLSQATHQAGPLIALLQCNVDQRMRNIAHGGDDESRREARQKVADHFADLTNIAVEFQPDLIVTAETAYPGYWEEIAPGKPSKTSRELAKRLANRWQTSLLLGMNSAVLSDDGKVNSYNSAILLARDGSWQGRYNKVHRVPFGEYVPLRSFLPVLDYLAPYDYDYTVTPGDSFTRFTIPSQDSTFRFGVLICYEDTDPAISRPYVQSPSVDFLLNISNDGWFDGSSEHDQHLAQCRFRAIETRRSVARAVNMGISAVIDSNGKVMAPSHAEAQGGIPLWRIGDTAPSLPISRWQQYKQIAGVLLARIPIDSRTSFYGQWGDLFALGCCMFMLVLLFSRLRRQESVVLK